MDGHVWGARLHTTSSEAGCDWPPGGPAGRPAEDARLITIWTHGDTWQVQQAGTDFLARRIGAAQWEDARVLGWSPERLARSFARYFEDADPPGARTVRSCFKVATPSAP